MAIPLIGPDGREYELDNADPKALEEVLRQGFKQQLPKYEPQTTGEKALQLGADAAELAGTGAFGVLQGMTGGLAGAALGAKHGKGPTSLQEEAATAAQQQIEKHKEAYVAGDVAGALLSPLGKLQGAVTKGLGATTALGRLGANVAGGAGVGALYGAGNTMSDAALGDYDLTAEKLFAGVGLGAIVGGAGAGLGSALEEAIGAVVPRASKAASGSKDELEKWANNRALKAAGAAKSDLAYMGPEKAQEVGQMLLERGHLGKGLEAPNAAGVLKSVSAEKELIGKQLGKVFDDAHALGAQPAYSKVLQRLDDFEAGLSPLQRKAVSGEVQSAREAVLEYGAKPAGAPGSGFKALNELKQDLQSKAKWSAADPGQAFAGGLKRQLSGVVRDELDTQLVNAIGPDAGKGFLEAKKLYGLLSDAERIAEHGAEKLGGNASFGLRDLGMGAAAGLGTGNPITGMISAIASKTLRERGQGVIARLAHEISASPRLSVAAQSFSTQLGAAAPQLGRYAPMLERAAASSPALALATHMTWAQADPEYAGVAQLAGFLPETPAEHDSAMFRAGGIAGVASILDHNNNELDRGVEKVLKGKGTPRSVNQVFASQDFGAKRMRRDSAEAHRQRMEEIQALAADPTALLDKVVGNMGQLGDVAPGVAAAVTNTAHRAVAFLAKECAVPPKAGPLAPDWVHNDAEIHAFARVLETVQDPMSVLHHAASGTLTADQVRALNAVYPTLGRQIADKLLSRLTENPKAVPYRARLMVGMLTGTDPDGSMGLAVAQNQAIINAASSKPSNQGMPGASTSSGKSPLTIAQRTATPSQRSEME